MKQRFTIIISLLFLFTGCASPKTTPEPTATLVPSTSTPVPPTSTPRPSCENVEESCLELTFDGESCTYEGPAEVAPGPVRLFFHNDSEGDLASVNFMKLLEGRTSEDMFRWFGGRETLASVEPPYWRRDLGTYGATVLPGETRGFLRTLEPGNYHMVCVRKHPKLVWLGAGFTVEE